MIVEVVKWWLIISGVFTVTYSTLAVLTKWLVRRLEEKGRIRRIG